MKRVLLSLAVLCSSQFVNAQNTFPATGAVGIGITTPQAALHVSSNGRQYFVNKAITGVSEDSQGLNYILLHKAYNGTLIADQFVNGVITGIRGGSGSSNRKLTVEVNTASAYNTNRGSLISYNEGARLVRLTYNSELYLAVEITNTSSLFSFSFTGYAGNYALQLVYDQHVSNVQVFTAYDAVSVPGTLATGDFRVSRTAGTFTSSFANIRGVYLDGGGGIGELGVGFMSGSGGSSAVGFGRGSSWDSYLKFYTNPASSAGVMNMTERMRITPDGNVGIGTTNPGSYKLAVEGTIGARKVKVTQLAWADFVFDPGYHLPSLGELEQFIKQHQHLPGVPTTAEVEKDGVDLGEMNVRLLQKVEELTLYLIEQQKQVASLNIKVKKLESVQQKSTD